MTERGDPRAIYDVVYGCNPDTDALQKELRFKARADLPGGHICVRLASGDRHEFRYSPPGNTGMSSALVFCYKTTFLAICVLTGWWGKQPLITRSVSASR